MEFFARGLCFSISNCVVFLAFRCGGLSARVHQPFFSNLEFFSSPPKPFTLSSYAEGIARQFAEQRISDRSPRPVFVSARVLKFVDQEAVESDGEASVSDCSDVEESMSASSSPKASFDASP
jgi:hypothetical protein